MIWFDNENCIEEREGFVCTTFYMEHVGKSQFCLCEFRRQLDGMIQPVFGRRHIPAFMEHLTPIVGCDSIGWYILDYLCEAIGGLVEASKHLQR